MMSGQPGNRNGSANGCGGRAQTGLVILNTGNGKGKTTAALGMLLRARGHGMKVIMLQFVKKAGLACGEHRAAPLLGIEIVSGGAGFVRRGGDMEKGRLSASALWAQAREKIASGDYQVVVLDEVTYPLSYGWIQVGEVLRVLADRPRQVHVVITGRNAPAELIDFADIVTEMTETKHSLKKGIKAQAGIEF